MSASFDPRSAGYGFVPFAPDVHRARREQAVHDRRVADTVSGAIEVTLQALQSIHVGSGHKRVQRGAVVTCGARIDGHPGVYGASFKGVLRARFEAITRSCAILAPRRNALTGVRSSTGIQRARLHPDAWLSAWRACDSNEMCAACALFGRMSQRGRLAVTDLACTSHDDFTIARMPARFSPNLHHVGRARPVRYQGSDIFEVRSVYGRKFAVDLATAGDAAVGDRAVERVEAIREGAELSGRLLVSNLRLAELGGLLAALGYRPSSVIKLGGGKAHRFGQVRCVALRWTLRDHRGASLMSDIPAWRQRFEQSPDYWPDGERALFALHDRGV